MRMHKVAFSSCVNVLNENQLLHPACIAFCFVQPSHAVSATMKALRLAERCCYMLPYMSSPSTFTLFTTSPHFTYLTAEQRCTETLISVQQSVVASDIDHQPKWNTIMPEPDPGACLLG